MFSWLTNAWRVPELRRRVIFTALILGVYRFGSWLPAPGIDPSAIKQYFSSNQGSILTLLNLFSGSALSRFSLFALGIMPYVTASIILQLLTVVIRGWSNGRRKAKPATRRSTSTRATS